MKNIMVIDGAENCVYDVFAASDDDLALIFPEETDIAFIEDIERRQNAEVVFEALKRTWSNRVPKHEARGVHGIVCYQLYDRRKYYPPCGMRKPSIPTVRHFASDAFGPFGPGGGPD